LFDIQGFFDNINHNRLVRVFVNLGFAPELVSWCKSFLTNRSVHLKFNGKSSDPLETEVGMPVSPVLSIIYTSPLLHLMQSWNNTLLGMYIDDGAIFACRRDWDDVANILRERYVRCMEWLTKAGLKAEPDKTELIFFKRSRDKSVPPASIQLPFLTPNMHYRVQATNTL